MEYSINNNKEHNNVWTTLRMRNMKHTPLIWMEGKQSSMWKVQENSNCDNYNSIKQTNKQQQQSTIQ